MGDLTTSQKQSCSQHISHQYFRITVTQLKNKILLQRQPHFRILPLKIEKEEENQTHGPLMSHSIWHWSLLRDNSLAGVYLQDLQNSKVENILESLEECEWKINKILFNIFKACRTYLLITERKAKIIQFTIRYTEPDSKQNGR